MRIAIVNDSLEAVDSLQRIIARDPSLSVCWAASNGKEAAERCLASPPDLILMDLFMPVMDGVEATRQIMEKTPCLIIVVTTSVSKNAGKIFEAMGAGAVDVAAVSLFDKKERSGDELLKKIHIIGSLAGVGANLSYWLQTDRAKKKMSDTLVNLVVIGCSTGGPMASLKILSTFPADFPAAFVLVQHMDERFTGGLADWLNQQTELDIKLLKDDDRLQKGKVLVSSAGAHAVLKENGRIGYLYDNVNGIHYVPSIDLFFKSVAEKWTGKSVGVLLTGMGRDGAEGLLAMKEKGMVTIAQDRETSVVFGMPKAAIELGAAQYVLPLDKIGVKINAVIQQQD